QAAHRAPEGRRPGRPHLHARIADQHRARQVKRSLAMRTILSRWVVATALAAGAISLPAGAEQVTPSAADKVTINGWALNMSNIATGANQSIRINIDKWSSPSQRQHLIDTILAEHA